VGEATIARITNSSTLMEIMTMAVVDSSMEVTAAAIPPGPRLPDSGASTDFT